jgi:hypothetical protein
VTGGWWQRATVSLPRRCIQPPEAAPEFPLLVHARRQSDVSSDAVGRNELEECRHVERLPERRAHTWHRCGFCIRGCADEDDRQPVASSPNGEMPASVLAVLRAWRAFDACRHHAGGYLHEHVGAFTR